MATIVDQSRHYGGGRNQAAGTPESVDAPAPALPVELTSDEMLFLSLFMSLDPGAARADIYGGILELARELLAADDILFFDYENEDDRFRLESAATHAGRALAGNRISFQKGLVRQSFMIRASLGGDSSGEGLESFLGRPVSSMAVAPLILDERVAAVVIGVSHCVGVFGFPSTQRLARLAFSLSGVYRLLERVEILGTIMKKGSNLGDIGKVTNSASTEKIARLSALIQRMAQGNDNAIEFILGLLGDIEQYASPR